MHESHEIPPTMNCGGRRIMNNISRRKVRKTPLRSHNEMLRQMELLDRRRIDQTPDILRLVVTFLDKRIKRLEKR